jgi:hypothetical protein
MVAGLYFLLILVILERNYNVFLTQGVFHHRDVHYMMIIHLLSVQADKLPLPMLPAMAISNVMHSSSPGEHYLMNLNL